MRSAPLRSAAVSDPGNVRGNNEDRVYVDDERGIYIVIDGVGGQAAGERAAAIAEEELVARLARSTGTVEDRIREGIALAGKRILEHARRNPDLEGMACVLTVAVVSNGEALIGHVGDTRLYKIRGSAIEKVTRDHSPVGAREDAGEISEQAAMKHPRRNEIFRDVGSEEHAPGDAGFIDIHRIPFEPDAALLLCSDGLTDQVTSGEILAAAQRNAGDPWRIARELIRLANDAGGKDNVSVVYVEGPAVGQPSLPADPPVRAGKHRTAMLVAALLAGLVLGAIGMALAWTYLAPGTAPERRVLTVSPGVVEGAGEYTFPTIADALAAARPGDTVEVQPGTYREQVEMKDGVRLAALSPGEAILEPAADASRPAAAVVIRNVRTGALSGFRISLPQESGVSIGVLVADSDVDINGIEVSGAASAGLVISGGSKPNIRGSHIHHNGGAGIIVQDAAAPSLTSNVITNNGNKPGAPRAALEIAAGANPVFTANAFADNHRNVAWDKFPAREAEVLKSNLVVISTRRPRPAAPPKEYD